MDKRSLAETLGGFVMVVLLVAFLDPFMLFMPSMLTYTVLALVLVLFGVFAGMVWREQPHDEREAYHAQWASRAAYLTGLGVLVVGASYQALTYMIDPWLFAAIATMVTVKLVARIYVQLTA